MNSIDLNADLGEGYGPWSLSDDRGLMDYISSANIACGFHAGDPNHMQSACAYAVAQNVCIGAHPGFDDKPGFGRRIIGLTSKEITAMVAYQIGAAQAIAKLCGTRVRYVKAHGALANWAAEDRTVADALMAAVDAVDPNLHVLAMANTQQVKAASARNLNIAEEAFIDRAYLQNGMLAPRNQQGAVYQELDQQLEQVFQILHQQRVKTIDGKWLALRADSLCLHGDGAHAVQTAKSVHRAIVEQGIEIKRFVPCDEQH